MQVLITFLFLSIIFGIILAKRSKKITWSEFWVVIGLSFIIVLLLHTIFYKVKVSDTKYISDEVISVRYEPEWTQSYSCCKVHGRCCHGSGKKRTCHTCCKVWGTCYRQQGDEYHYTLSSSAIHSLTHSEFKRLRTDLVDKPAPVKGDRYNYVRGDLNDYIYTPKKDVIIPWTATQSWDNKVKASMNIIKYKMKDSEKVEDYPDIIYSGLFNYNRVIGIDKTILNPRIISEWDAKLKDKNIILYGFKNGTYSDCEKLDSEWIGGKINDIIFCILYNDNLTMSGVKIISWTENEEMKHHLNSLWMGKNIKDIPSLQKSTLEIIQNEFVENDFKKYGYLSVHFSFWDFFWIILISVILISGMWGIAYVNDITDEDPRYWI